MPDWYPLVRAARYLGVPPWVLDQESIAWRERALLAEQAEVAHQNHLNKAQRKSLGSQEH